MSSSPTSSSSISPTTTALAEARFPGLTDVVLPVAVRLGSGLISVGDCLGLRPQSVVRLVQPAGQDLDIVVNGEVVARCEVAIVDDSTSVRLTDIAVGHTDEVVG